MQRFLVVSLVVLLCGIALADDARQLRLEAGALVQAAEVADSTEERRALLEEAYGKLLEIRERFPSESARLTLYLGGRRVNLSPEDVAAMMAAAPSADLDIGNLREVLGRMPSPVAVDENGWTDLHWAAALNLPELAEALLDAGADVAAPMKADGEPLSERLQQSLHELDLFPELTRRGYLPLHIAAFNDAWESATLLIARGADIHAKASHNGFTPLHAAAAGNASKVAVELIARGADIHAKNKVGFTPLHYAAYSNASEIAADLIARGADMHAKSDDGKTPLQMAGEGGSSAVLAVLKKAERESLGRLPMVRVEGGNFTMGCQSEPCYDDEKPAHQVRVGSFEIGQYEVTQELWQAVMGDNPSRFKDCSQCPVESVSSLGDVQAFLRKLNQLTGKRYRLPTEAEWEYAARGGQQSRGYEYAGSDESNSVAWHHHNSGGKTHPVGQKAPNELGLYDMSGNVSEWVQDCWNDGYQGAPGDGSARESGDCSQRVVRGGAWRSTFMSLHVTFRSGGSKFAIRSNAIGFRIARTLTP